MIFILLTISLYEEMNAGKLAAKCCDEFVILDNVILILFLIYNIYDYEV